VFKEHLVIPGAGSAPVQRLLLKPAQDPLQAGCPDIRASPLPSHPSIFQTKPMLYIS